MLLSDHPEDIQTTAHGEMGREQADIRLVFGHLSEHLGWRRGQGRHTDSALNQRRGKRLDDQTMRVGQYELHQLPARHPGAATDNAGRPLGWPREIRWTSPWRQPHRGHVSGGSLRPGTGGTSATDSRGGCVALWPATPGARQVLSGSRPARWGMYPLEGTITMTGHLSVTTTPAMDPYSPLAAVGTWWAWPSDPQTVSQLPTLWAPGGWPSRRSPSSC